MSTIKQMCPYLRLRRAAQAIEFYKSAFGAHEQYRLTEPSGRIGHAELQFGGTTVMLADEYPENGIQGPESLGGTTIALHLQVEDVDELARQAEAAGATVIRELKDQFYGERTGVLRDPFGHEWLVSQHIENVTPEEMQRRFQEMAKG